MTDGAEQGDAFQRETSGEGKLRSCASLRLCAVYWRRRRRPLGPPPPPRRLFRKAQSSRHTFCDRQESHRTTHKCQQDCKVSDWRHKREALRCRQTRCGLVVPHRLCSPTVIPSLHMPRRGGRGREGGIQSRRGLRVSAGAGEGNGVRSRVLVWAGTAAAWQRATQRRRALCTASYQWGH